MEAFIVWWAAMNWSVYGKHCSMHATQNRLSWNLLWRNVGYLDSLKNSFKLFFKFTENQGRRSHTPSFWCEVVLWDIELYRVCTGSWSLPMPDESDIIVDWHARWLHYLEKSARCSFRRVQMGHRISTVPGIESHWMHAA